jgi:hypothetical protein
MTKAAGFASRRGQGAGRFGDRERRAVGQQPGIERQRLGQMAHPRPGASAVSRRRGAEPCGRLGTRGIRPVLPIDPCHFPRHAEASTSSTLCRACTSSALRAAGERYQPSGTSVPSSV